MVYVTHDQTEALTFAEQVVVMYEGEIVQIGTPAELFERPKHTFVGYFIGSPGMNVMPVAVEGGTARLGSADDRAAGRADGSADGAIELGIRPEYRPGSARDGHAGADRRKVEDIGRHKIVPRQPRRAATIAAIARRGRRASRPTRRSRFDPAGINLYADSWRVEMGA